MDLNLHPTASAGARNFTGGYFGDDLVDDVSPGSSSEFHWRRLLARRFYQTSYFHPALAGKVEVVEAEETEEEKSKKSASFECNICFDMANEPVVTSCGHLFCWPCLYRWLHVHSHYKECPVCKGEVGENNVIPIYGRGTTRDDISYEPNGENDEDFNIPDLNIPPRPRGNRVERLWSSGGGIDGHSERILNDWSRNSLIRRNLTALECTANERRNSDRNNINNNDTSINPFGDGFNLNGTARARLDFLGRLMGRSADNRQLPSAPACLLPVGLTEGGDQTPTSSTMAVIEGDSAGPGGSLDPSSAGSSRHIKRGRSSSTSSVHEDGGGIHGRKSDLNYMLVGGLAEGEDQAPASSTMAVIEEDSATTGDSSRDGSGSVDADGGGVRGHKSRRMN